MWFWSDSTGGVSSPPDGAVLLPERHVTRMSTNPVVRRRLKGLQNESNTPSLHFRATNVNWVFFPFIYLNQTPYSTVNADTQQTDKCEIEEKRTNK